MKKWIYANTYFEFELAKKLSYPLVPYLEKHPLFLQLQFLPLLYASPEDTLLVSHLPSSSYLEKLQSILRQPLAQIALLEDDSLSEGFLESWGSSFFLKNWAKKHKIQYLNPDQDITSLINDKIFSYTYCPQLAKSQLIYNEKELNALRQKTTTSIILKSSFGVASLGNIILPPYPKSLSKKSINFLYKFWNSHQVLIAEPFVDRLDDFSTQWHISSIGRITYIGAVRLKNGQNGGFQHCVYGPNDSALHDIQDFLEEHKKHAYKTLNLLKDKGFFGYLGLDSMIYKDQKGQILLHPIVEINARQTMALACIFFQNKHHPYKHIQLSYIKSSLNGSLLPENILKKNKGSLQFPQKLFIKIMDKD